MVLEIRIWLFGLPEDASITSTGASGEKECAIGWENQILGSRPLGTQFSPLL